MMFWKKIKALKEENALLKESLSCVEERNKEQKDKIESLTNQIAGERVKTDFCEVCVNGVYSLYDGYFCAFNCKCKDFEKKE